MSHNILLGLLSYIKYAQGTSLYFLIFFVLCAHKILRAGTYTFHEIFLSNTMHLVCAISFSLTWYLSLSIIFSCSLYPIVTFHNHEYKAFIHINEKSSV
uniref:Uncharacterized protein n=1 Tax=Oryza brachyantha TaxID=4533 RepID=J3LBE1_ORYBR